MSRTLKNVLTIIFIIVLLCTSFFTVNFAKSAGPVDREQSMQTQDTAPPEMSDKDNKDSLNGQQPPEVSSGENRITDGSEQPPEMPDTENKDSSNGQQPPEKPEGEDNSDSSNSNNPPEIPKSSDENGFENFDGNNKPFGISTVYYILFIAQSLLISLALLYLIMSGFNKKSFKETFKSKLRLLICIFGSVILACGLTFSEIYISTRIVYSSFSEHMKQDKNGEKPRFDDSIETTEATTEN